MSKLIINSDIISYILHKKYFFEYLLKFTNQDEANQTVNKKISDSYARIDDDGKRLIFDLLINQYKIYKKCKLLRISIEMCGKIW